MKSRAASCVSILVIGALLSIAGCGGGGGTDTPAPTTPTPPVTPAAVASVAVVLSAPSAMLGQTVQATVTTRDAAGNQLAGRAVSWTSTATTIATVSANGLVTAVAAGTAQITATSEGVSGTQTFSAVPLPAVVDSITLSLDSAEVIIADTLRIVAVARDAAGTAIPGIKLSYTSSDTTVATVSPQGLVTSVDVGEAVIEVAVAAAMVGESAQQPAPARSGNGRSRMRILSTPKLIVTPDDKTVDISESVQYAARLTNVKGALLPKTYPIRWSAGSGGAATIDANGLAKGVKPGTTTITASVVSGVAREFTPKSVKLKVTVCNGITDVLSWNAHVASSYVLNPSFDVGPVLRRFTLNQSSSGDAVLIRTSLDADGASAVWEGVPAGVATVANRYETTISGNVASTITELGSSPMQAGFAYVKLSVAWGPLSGCLYSVRYKDGATYDFKQTPKPPDVDRTSSGGLGIAAAHFRPVGLKPATGWSFAGDVSAPAMNYPLTGDDLELPLAINYYAPLLTVPLSAIALNGMGQLQQALFSFTLKAR